MNQVQNPEVRATRFVPGMKYIFIAADFTRGKPMTFTSVYRPWSNVDQGGDVFHGFRIVVLECTEHRRVPGDWSDVIEHDGFIFKQVGGNIAPPEGVVWVNQYPRASYGQLSDYGDRMVRIHSNDSSDKSVSAAIDWVNSVFIGRSFGNLTQAETFIEAIADGQAEMLKMANKGEPAPEGFTWDQIQESMTRYLNEVLKAIQEVIETPLEITITPHKFNLNDGTERVLDNRFDTTIIWKE